MNNNQFSWCRSQGINAETVEDCDPFTGLVTFKNGIIRQKTEVYTRCMGYHRPVSFFNAGKQSEHRERTYFSEARGEAYSGVTYAG